MLIPRQTNRPKKANTSMCMEVNYKVSFAWSFPSPCFGRLCSHVAVVLAWLLHHFPSSKSLDCPLSSLWTILPIDIESSARSDGVRVMFHWTSVRWTFVFFISSSLCCFFHATHVIHPSSSRRCPLSGAFLLWPSLLTCSGRASVAATIHYCCLFYYAGEAKMFSVETWL